MERRQIWPVFDEDQVAAVSDLLRSGKVNAWTGPDVRAFESEFAAYCGTEFGIAMANGSVTLDAALRALELKPGDEVIVSPRSFVASASCVLLAGGRPVFADIDPDSQNITAETIEAVTTDRTRGIIPVHLAGWPCDMDGIMAFARQRDLWVVEDCAQAHGAKFGDRVVGSFGDVGSYSFCQDKIMSTGGEGGMIVTNDEKLYDRIWSYKDHGKDRALVFAPNPQPGFRWLHANQPGTNLRMTGISAAIGRIQLKRLPEWREIRAANAKRLADALSVSPALRIPMPPFDVTHAWYRFYAFVRPDRLKPGWDRDRILAAASERGVTLFSGSCSEIYREKIFAAPEHHPAAPLPVAQALAETSLAFLVDPTWSERELDRVNSIVLKILLDASK
ncbi:DegT/DnrJ/EryC1/StrS aminotransferase family protein [Paracoccus sp. SCSIO 75233]|uniref:DegT/DnrJ/EryC1/StrS family aminotransferase n=1 Tax=Paracoccus sp. SCSIO 75233 TaxID=3017782 RepID=UPI0022F0DE05|nr:DegT/DnrJ/EryC1/StrS aminotransferase family protein [Paracoccus sp. SCSIO 75233]WBU52623.1 DegT/DnrJ/EryC1/StrS aminotransferase family protein [Paracoccus sp. SCSIO 75233]